MNKILSIDVGQTNTGLAITDNTGTIPMPYKTIKEKDKRKLAKKISVIYNEKCISKILVGYPLNINDTKSKQTEYVESFINELEKYIEKKNIIKVDEKYSTIATHGKLKNIGLNRKKRSKIIDSATALRFLQEYLNLMI